MTAKGDATLVYTAAAEARHELITAGHTEGRSFQALSSPSSAAPSLAFRVSGVQASVVVLTFVADNMSYSVNVASGVIVALNSTTFSALSGTGRLDVLILSTGSLAADFYVSVTACTVGTFDVLSRTLTLRAGDAAQLQFPLRYEITNGTDAGQCNVTLQDALYRVVDWRLHRFNVTPLVPDRGPQGGSPPGGDLGGPALPPVSGGSDGGGGGSCTDCPFYNPVCFVLRSCFWQVIVQIVVVFVIIGAVVLAIRHRKALCCCLYESPEAAAERRHQEQLRAVQAAADDARCRRRCPPIRRSAAPPPALLSR